MMRVYLILPTTLGIQPRMSMRRIP